MVTRRGFLARTWALAPLLWDPPGGALLRRRSPAPRRLVHLHSGAVTDGLAGARFAAAELRHTAALLGLEVEMVERSVSSEREARDAIAESRAGGALGLTSTLTGEAQHALQSEARLPAIHASGGGLPSRGCATAPFSTGVPLAEAARVALHVLGESVHGEEWIFIAPDDPNAAPVASYVARLLEQSGARLRRAISPDAAIGAIGSNPPDGIVLGLDPRGAATGELIGRLTNGASLERTRIVVLGDLQLPGNRPAETVHVLAWHPTLYRFGAAQLNDRYRRAVGRGMSSDAWSAWIAVKLLGEAVLRRNQRGVGEFLANSEARFDGHKGAPLSFRPSDRWLRQPLYVTRQASSAAEGGDPADIAYADGAPATCLTGGAASS